MLPVPAAAASAMDPRHVLGEMDKSGGGGGVVGVGGGVGGVGGGGVHSALYSSRSPAATAQRWTEEQSMRLRDLVAESGPKDWTNIAKKVRTVVARERERRRGGSGSGVYLFVACFSYLAIDKCILFEGRSGLEGAAGAGDGGGKGGIKKKNCCKNISCARPIEWLMLSFV